MQKALSQYPLVFSLAPRSHDWYGWPLSCTKVPHAIALWLAVLTYAETAGSIHAHIGREFMRTGRTSLAWLADAFKIVTLES